VLYSRILVIFLGSRPLRLASVFFLHVMRWKQHSLSRRIFNTSDASFDTSSQFFAWNSTRRHQLSIETRGNFIRDWLWDVLRLVDCFFFVLRCSVATTRDRDSFV